ncbi:hypothetical protein DM02DRAFT_678204 [Periconia macrospinosa]|uniref:Uncharacterized protein n=1 Tax=Periconia macrospinosa TaxID=97972 RepID=A0A2V1CZM9_9PLEO|nr:hypothetical protein DM02DRAFT_678204 [Periconia macrospinosa]
MSQKFKRVRACECCKVEVDGFFGLPWSDSVLYLVAGFCWSHALVGASAPRSLGNDCNLSRIHLTATFPQTLYRTQIALSMASIDSQLDDIKRSFLEDGLFYVEDSAIGDQVKEIQKKGFPIESAAGLDFCQRNVLDDIRTRRILESLFPWSGLGIYEVYRTDANHIYAFMTGLNTELKAVVVQLLSPQSSMVVYGGSQSLQIKGFNASNGLLEIPYAPLKKCKPIEVNMEKGGLAVLDARLAFKNLKGFAIYFVFATKEELEDWPKKIFPAGQGLEQKALQMNSSTIGLNFAFKNN